MNFEEFFQHFRFSSTSVNKIMNSTLYSLHSTTSNQCSDLLINIIMIFQNIRVEVADMEGKYES